MVQLDEKSKEFIEFTKVALKDRTMVTALRFYIYSKVIEFADNLFDDPKLLDECIDKMLKGAAEHGEPIHSEEFFSSALKEEIMDCFLWELMKRWNIIKKNG